MESEIRKSYFYEKYIIFAPKRKLRPQIINQDEDAKNKFKDSCHFCSGSGEDKETAIYKFEKNNEWLVKVIDNKFPALTLENNKAYGKQEVVVDTPVHGQDFSDLSVQHIKAVLDTYASRISSLSEIPGINYVQVFKNDGGKAGASIPHAHSQIIAIRFIPEKIRYDSIVMDEYSYKNGTCPYCDVVIKEKEESKRVICEDNNIIAFCPYASSSPYSAWIIPKNHKRRLAELSGEERLSVALALKIITSKLDKACIPYNFFLHDSLPQNTHHFRLKIATRMNTWGGFELGSGFIINPVLPEDAANFYREFSDENDTFEQGCL